MPSTPILGITQVSTSQSGKEITINDAIMALEAATNAKLTVSMAAGNVTLTAEEATRNFIFKATSATVARELLFPIAVNGNPYNRIIVVRNDSGYQITVKFAAGAGSTVIIPNGQSRLISAADGADMTVAAEPPSVVNFLSLTDTPGSYTGSSGKFLAVNVAENALEFISGATYPSFATNAGKFLVVNAGASGVEWVAPDFAEDFLDLNDTPASYSGQAGKVVRVNAGGTALEFAELDEPEAVLYVEAQRWRIFALEPGVWPENPPELDPSDPEYLTPTDQIGFGEVEFLDLDFIDLATGGTAVASSEEVGFDADLAFNNVTTSGDGWLTDEGVGGDQWIEYQFAAPVTVRHVRLRPVGGAPYYSPMRFLIQYWDGDAWVSLGDRTAATWVTDVTQTFKVNGIPFTAVQEAPADGSLYGRRDNTWVSIAADVIADATTSHDLAAGDVGKYRRFTNGGSKTLNIRTNAVHAMPNGEWHIRNEGAGTILIVPAGGVVVNLPPDGTLEVPQGGTITIKRIAADTYDLFGNVIKTTEAGVAEVFPTLATNAGKVLAVNATEDNIEWVPAATDEQIRDVIAAALTAGANITITPNDAGDSIEIAVSGSLGLSAEDVRDTIANALTAGSGIDIVVDDAGDTITIVNTGGGGGGGSYTDEQVRDVMGAALTAGANITITPNDAGDTIEIAVSGSLGLSAEDVRDTIAAALTAGDNVTIDVNDAGDTITINAIGSADAMFPAAASWGAHPNTVSTSSFTTKGFMFQTATAVSIDRLGLVFGGAGAETPIDVTLRLVEVSSKTAGTITAVLHTCAPITVDAATNALIPLSATIPLTTLDPAKIYGVIGTISTGTVARVWYDDGSNFTMEGIGALAYEGFYTNSAPVATSAYTIAAGVFSGLVWRAASAIPFKGTRRTGVGPALTAGATTTLTFSDADYDEGGWGYAAGVFTVPTGVTKIDVNLNIVGASVADQLVGSIEIAADGVSWTTVSLQDTDTAGVEGNSLSVMGYPVTPGVSKIRGRGFSTNAQTLGSGSIMIRAVSVIAESAELPALAGNANKVLAVNSGATGVEWQTPSAGYTDEQVRDVMSAALVAGANVTITPNDAGDTITISASGGGGGGGGGGASAPFKGVLVHKDANETAADYSTAAAVSWDSETNGYDTDSWHSTTVNPSRLTIPAATTYVRLVAQLTFANVAANAIVYATIKKNGVAVQGIPLVMCDTAATTPRINMTSPPITCIAGDYFEVFLSSSDTSIDIIAADSWFAAEAVASPQTTGAGDGENVWQGHLSTLVSNVTGAGTYYTLPFNIVQQARTFVTLNTTTGVATINTSGTYCIEGGVRFTGGSAGDWGTLGIFKNGVFYKELGVEFTDEAVVPMHVMGFVDCVPGDTIEIRARVGGTTAVYDIPVSTGENFLRITKLSVSTRATVANYPVPAAFTAPPGSGEVVMLHVFAEPVTFADDWNGSKAYVGFNPVATFTMTVSRITSGVSTDVGTISISTAGVATFATTGGTVSYGIGDVLIVTAPATVDGGIANVAVTILGTRD